MHEWHQEKPAHDPNELELGKPVEPGAEDPKLPMEGLPENPVEVPDETNPPFDKPLQEIEGISNKDGISAEINTDDYRETR